MKWYKYDIRELTDDEYLKAYSMMSLEKKQRVDRFRFSDDKKRTVVGEILARKAIAEWCHVSEQEIRFEVTEYGKPFAIGLDVEFNISHSGDMVVCAVSDRPIGIDVEQIRPIHLRVANYVCTKEELLYIFGEKLSMGNMVEVRDNEMLTRFFKIWTQKEAYGKCIGVGVVDLRNQNTDYKNKSTICMEGYIVSICY